MCTIIVAVAYCVFSVGTTYLNFEINPLSMHPLASCSGTLAYRPLGVGMPSTLDSQPCALTNICLAGRVECFWTLSKIAALSLVFLSEIISAEAVAVFLLIINASVLFLHLNLLPFHDPKTNMARAGIYAAATWFSGSCLIVRLEPDSPGLQWALLCLIPVAFFLGFGAAYGRQQSLKSFMILLRSLWEKQAGQNSTLGQGRRYSMTNGDMSRRSSITATTRQTARTTHDKFFGSDWNDQVRAPCADAARPADARADMRV